MANEKRLIDANALTEHIKDLPTWYDDGGLSWACIEGYPKGNFDPQDIISSIENAPTVDAEEVGRCKGCYYYESSNPGHGYCKYFEILRVDNDFCSSWERKDNG